MVWVGVGRVVSVLVGVGWVGSDRCGSGRVGTGRVGAGWVVSVRVGNLRCGVRGVVWTYVRITMVLKIKRLSLHVNPSNTSQRVKTYIKVDRTGRDDS